ncbi:hypothetical protein HGB41_10020 [Massilia sp. ML15P13]|uniref:DUF4399 domain-containing protein n=2 Tax=Telluria aromaticivorans TaxID=2725995 RepID=A0A7Y2JYY6_9BURK|nr:hypothetical protein [Telluria aromaticivorans]
MPAHPTPLSRRVAAALFAVLLGMPCPAALAQAGRAPPVLPLASEPPPRLAVHPPVPEALARGVIILQFRTENLRTMAVVGPKAAEVSPRLGHLHVTVDQGPPTWAHTSTDPIIIVGLPPGRHKLKLEMADPTHRILGGETVEVTVPGAGGASHGH